MHLTLFTDYALRTLIFLAVDPGRRVSIAEITGAYGISENHLTKVVHRLGQSGLIMTTRGRNGGIELGRPAGEIGLGDVVRAMEPSLALVGCQAGEPCAIQGPCALQGVMDQARDAVLEVLDRHTLADVASPRHRGLRARLGMAASG